MDSSQSLETETHLHQAWWDRKFFRYGSVIVLLAVFMILNLTSIRFNSLTEDEEYHYRYGANILNLDSNRFDDSKMPVSALNALPGKIAPLIPSARLQAALGKVQAGRYVTMLISALLALLVFYWSRSLYGWLAGIFALFLYVFDPNIIAHSRLVTTDIYAAAAIALAIYTTWRFSRRRSWGRAAVGAAILGIAQLAKYTSVFLYPLLFILILLRDSPLLIRLAARRRFRQLSKYLGRSVVFMILFTLVSLLVINAGFLFNRTFLPLEKYNFRSELFKSIQTSLAPIKPLPVPVPFPYLQGLDWVRQREQTGEGYGRIYLLGELRESGGFKGYFIYAALLKVPIAIQLITLAALVSYVIRRRQFHFRRDELFLLGPALFFWIYFNFFYGAQIGFRFILILFPLVYVFCGSLLKGWQEFHVWAKVSVSGLALYLVISVLSYHPHYLAYFNEIVWDRRLAYRYLADSNLDWGQGEHFLKQYLASHPEARFEPERPRDGVSVVRVNNLVGITEDPEKFRWLRENFTPDSMIAYVYLVYDISTPEFEQARNSGRINPQP